MEQLSTFQDIILKHELYLRMFANECFDWLESSDAKVDNGSGGECNSDNFTFLPKQHISGVSFLNLRALQSKDHTWMKTVIIIKIVMKCTKI